MPHLLGKDVEDYYSQAAKTVKHDKNITKEQVYRALGSIAANFNSISISGVICFDKKSLQNLAAYAKEDSWIPWMFSFGKKSRKQKYVKKYYQYDIVIRPINKISLDQPDIQEIINTMIGLLKNGGKNTDEEKQHDLKAIYGVLKKHVEQEKLSELTEELIKAKIITQTNADQPLKSSSAIVARNLDWELGDDVGLFAQDHFNHGFEL